MPRPADDAGDERGRAAAPLGQAGAFLVHVFTASGAALGLLAMVAAVGADFPLMFVWLGLALTASVIASCPGVLLFARFAVGQARPPRSL